MSSFLLVRLGSLGDVIHAIPAAAALRDRYPDARIDWMVDPRYVELLRRVPVLNQIVALDPRAVWGPGRREFVGTLRRLRAVRYDAVIDLQGLLKSALLARLAGGAETIGFSRQHLREPSARFLYRRTVDPGDVRHVIEKNLALVAAAGVERPEIRFPFDVPEVQAGGAGPARGEPYALINPGAAWPNKRWAPEHFGSLAARIFLQFGLRSLVLWGPGERPIAQSVVDASAGTADLSTPTTIVDLIALAKGARLIVSGDTGPLHIAAAVGTPIVALFAPTDPERNGPWRSDDVVVSRWQECGCRYERSCRRATPCVETIGLEDVMEAVAQRLRTRA